MGVSLGNAAAGGSDVLLRLRRSSPGSIGCLTGLRCSVSTASSDPRMSARANTRFLPQSRDSHRAQRTWVLLIMLVVVWFGSACGSGNPDVPIGTSPPSSQAANPPVPEPPASSAPASSTASGFVLVPQGKRAKVFTEPSLSSTVVSSLPRGAAVQILCTAQGDTVVSDSGATSTLWDKTQYGYLPDVLVDTGTDQPVADSC